MEVEGNIIIISIYITNTAMAQIHLGVGAFPLWPWRSGRYWALD